MNVSGNMMNDELLQKATMEKIARLQQEVLQSPYETKQPREALASIPTQDITYKYGQ